MEGQRAGMVKHFAERSLQTYSYVYRNATDAQMEQYVRFAESPAAQRYHQAGIKAIDQTISQSALALGQDLGASMQERRNKSCWRRAANGRMAIRCSPPITTPSGACRSTTTGCFSRC